MYSRKIYIEKGRIKSTYIGLLVAIKRGMHCLELQRGQVNKRKNRKQEYKVIKYRGFHADEIQINKTVK